MTLAAIKVAAETAANTRIPEHADERVHGGQTTCTGPMNETGCDRQRVAITSTVIRRRVENVNVALPFYERLTGQVGHRFSFGDAELAAVGPFLLFSADGEIGDRLARVAGTIVVDDLDTQLQTLISLGAQVVAPPANTPNGRRLIARHPDGGVFEYVGR